MAAVPSEAELRARLAPFGQEHVLNHWAALSETEQAALAADVLSLDLAVTAAQFKRLQGSLWLADSTRRLFVCLLVYRLS